MNWAETFVPWEWNGESGVASLMLVLVVRPSHRR